MNLPNKLTIFRVLLIPLFVIVFYLPFLNQEIKIFDYEFNLMNIIAVVIFSIAAYTDRLDGKIARKRNLITTFGKFMDPLADKLLVASAFLIAIDLHLMPAYLVIIIISREFIVTGIRLLAITEGKVLAASSLGKIKTVFQIILVIVLFLFNYRSTASYVLFTNTVFLHLVVDILMIITTLFTLISGYDYVKKNKDLILQSK